MRGRRDSRRRACRSRRAASSAFLELCLRDAGQDTTGHCADIGLAVAANFRLIVHAAERNAGVSCGRSARAMLSGNGRFADARRADEAQNLPRQLRRELAHGKRFEDALLDLIQPKMVGVENARGGANIQPLLRALVPRQLQHKIEIIAQQRRLRRGGRLL